MQTNSKKSYNKLRSTKKIKISSKRRIEITENQTISMFFIEQRKKNICRKKKI